MRLTRRLVGHVIHPEIPRILELLDGMAGNCRQLDVSLFDRASADTSVTASIAFGGSQLILAAATLYHDDYVPTPWQTCLVYWASLLAALSINIFFNR